MIHFNKSDYEDPVARRDKIAVIRAQAKKLEESAKRKEIEIKYGKKLSVEDVFDANEFLLEAIESKLEVLEGMNA